MNNTFAKFKKDLNSDDLDTTYCMVMLIQSQYIDCIPSQNKIGEGINEAGTFKVWDEPEGL